MSGFGTSAAWLSDATGEMGSTASAPGLHVLDRIQAHPNFGGSDGSGVWADNDGNYSDDGDGKGGKGTSTDGSNGGTAADPNANNQNKAKAGAAQKGQSGKGAGDEASPAGGGPGDDDVPGDGTIVGTSTTSEKGDDPWGLNEDLPNPDDEYLDNKYGTSTPQDLGENIAGASLDNVLDKLLPPNTPSTTLSPQAANNVKGLNPGVVVVVTNHPNDPCFPWDEDRSDSSLGTTHRDDVVAAALAYAQGYARPWTWTGTNDLNGNAIYYMTCNGNIYYMTLELDTGETSMYTIDQFCNVTRNNPPPRPCATP